MHWICGIITRAGSGADSATRQHTQMGAEGQLRGARRGGSSSRRRPHRLAPLCLRPTVTVSKRKAKPELSSAARATGRHQNHRLLAMLAARNLSIYLSGLHTNPRFLRDKSPAPGPLEFMSWRRAGTLFLGGGFPVVNWGSILLLF
jgi:hypothetical protein